MVTGNRYGKFLCLRSNSQISVRYLKHDLRIVTWCSWEVVFGQTHIISISVCTFGHCLAINQVNCYTRRSICCITTYTLFCSVVLRLAVLTCYMNDKRIYRCNFKITICYLYFNVCVVRRFRFEIICCQSHIICINIGSNCFCNTTFFQGDTDGFIRSLRNFKSFYWLLNSIISQCLMISFYLYCYLSNNRCNIQITIDYYHFNVAVVSRFNSEIRFVQSHCVTACISSFSHILICCIQGDCHICRCITRISTYWVLCTSVNLLIMISCDRYNQLIWIRSDL